MPRRHAFTLLELIIVLIVLGFILSLAWPSMMSSYRRNRLQSTAKQVRSELGSARVGAIRDGQPYVFRFKPGTGEYVIGPQSALMSSSLEGAIAEHNLGVAESMAAEAQPAGAFASENSDLSLTEDNQSEAASDLDAITSSDAPPGEVRNLVDGVVFVDARMAASTQAQSNSDDPMAAMMLQQHSANASGWSEPILFYPNGRTSSATLRIRMQDGSRTYEIDVILRGLTGTAYVCDMRRYDPRDIAQDTGIAPMAGSQMGGTP